MKYYIADQHFGHANMIKFENRPFSSAEEMDKAMVREWNAVVKDNDEVYILGDFCFGDAARASFLLKSLKGIKYLIRGNHDKFVNNVEFDKYLFRWVKDYFLCFDGDKKIVLSHYPIAVWDMQHYGAYHFYGHVHSNIDNRHPVLAQLQNAYNVGADVIGFAPKTAEQIIRGQ